MDDNLAGLNLSDLSILYVLLAILILLALIAAIGAWARGGGIKREDAETLFNEQSDRSRKEVERLEELLAEARRAADEAEQASRDAQDRASREISARLQAVDEQVSQSRIGLEEVVSRASTEYTEALSEELELVTRKLNETDRRLTDKLGEMTGALAQIENQVNQAGESIRHALLEMTRQQQEQKAQSTIQLCEALISSLGTLKSTIANQLEDNRGPNAMQTDASVIEDEAARIGFANSADESDRPEVVPDSDTSTASDQDNASSDSVNLASPPGSISAETDKGEAEYQPFSTTEQHSPAAENTSESLDSLDSEDLDTAPDDSEVAADKDDADQDNEKQTGWG